MSSDEDVEKELMGKVVKRKKKPKVAKRMVDSDSEDGAAAGSPPRAQASPAAHADPSGSPTPVSPAPEAAPAAAADEPDPETLEEFYAMLQSTRKRRKYSPESEQTPAGKVAVAIDLDEINKTDREYTYQEMLALIFERIKGRGGKVRDEPFRLRIPQVGKDGSKKVVWINFPEICKSLNRSEDHLFTFALSELGTTGSLNGDHSFVLRGRFTDKHLEDLLRKYVSQYVACQMCRSLTTELNRDPHSRLTTLTCKQCNASRTVQSITSGFSAQIGRRKRR